MTRALTIAACLTLTGLVLLAQLAAVGHALTTNHAVCAEHGELVHDGGRPAVNSSVSLDLLGALPDSEHDHGCALLTGTCHSWTAPPPAVELPVPEPPPAPELVAPAFAAAPLRSRLAFAPKTSPPEAHATT